MIYLCIHLPAYRQLSRLRKEALTKAEEVIADFARESGCVSVAQGEGAWLFEVSSAGDGGENNRRKRRFAAEVFSLSGKLKEYERQLQGYNLLIDGVEGAKPTTILELLKTRVLSSGNDGELWISRDAIPSFEGIFVTVPFGGHIRKITGIAPGGEIYGRQGADFLVRDSLLSDFTDACESIYLGESEAGCIILVTEPDDGGVQTIEVALENMFSGTDASWVTTHGAETRFGDAVPVTSGVTESLDFFSISEHLTELELSVWESHLPAFFPELTEQRRSPGIDRLEVDCFQIIALQLAAYRRWMEEYLLPAVWLCERFDLLSSSVKNACARAAKCCVGSPGAIAAFVVQGQSVPEELLGVPHVFLRAPSLDRREIISKVAGASFLESNQSRDESVGNFAANFDESGGQSIVSLYRVLALLKNGGISSGVMADPLTALLSALDSDLQKALLHLIEGSLVLPEEPLTQYLEQSGLGREAVRLARQTVQELRLDIMGNADEALLAAACLRERLGINRKEALVNLASYIAEHIPDGGIPLSAAVVDAVMIGCSPKIGIDLITSYVKTSIESANIRSAAEVLDKAVISGADTDTMLLLNGLKLRTAILSADSRQAAEYYAELRAGKASGSQGIEGQRSLECSRYHFAAGSYQEGLQDAKDALMAFQQKESEQETEAYLYIGLHMLALSRVNEAEAYLQIARENASEISPMLFIVNGIYTAVTQFMIGNMTRAMAVIGEARSRAEECSLHRFEACLLFLEVRIQFELGRYLECVDLCLKGLTLCQLYGTEPHGVFEKWLRRAQAFSGFPDDAAAALSEIAADEEAHLFLAEAYYLAERKEKALMCLENLDLLSRRKPGRFLPAEGVFWNTGFSSVEDRAITSPGDRSVITMLIRAFRAYLSCGLNDSENGLYDLARITKEEKLSDIDPYNGIYFYFYAHAIGTTAGRNDLDRLTALNKAFKSIQERASMMDDSADRQSFLHCNYFNRLILGEAHESNLI